jgi:hypothetical protein
VSRLVDDSRSSLLPQPRTLLHDDTLGTQLGRGLMRDWEVGLRDPDRTANGRRSLGATNVVAGDGTYWSGL